MTDFKDKIIFVVPNFYTAQSIMRVAFEKYLEHAEFIQQNVAGDTLEYYDMSAQMARDMLEQINRATPYTHESS